MNDTLSADKPRADGPPPGDTVADVDAAGDDSRLHLLSQPLRGLLQRAPVTATPQLSIHHAAQLMRDQRVSSLLLVDADSGQLCGLVTDRDLRNRVLAAGLDPARPLADIATLQPMTLAASAPGFEALLLMARHNVHHVPVVEDGRPLGMVTATDVNQQHSTSAVFLAGDIARQATLAGLVACAGRVAALQRQLAGAGASAYATGHVVTAITDALTRRLLELAQQQLGPAPVPFAWVAAGSQARHEQTARSDQDNCLVLDDRFEAAAHGDYFEQLARQVCDGLAACGYIHCPGGIMAMTERWRQPQHVWAQQFSRWVDTPEPMALMLSCVFFDVRTVAGEDALLQQLRQGVLRSTRGNSLFLAHMVGNALKRQPPLGLFGGLSPQRGGEHKGMLDLKHNGIVPVVDLARIYALAAGQGAVNTHDRLEHAAECGEISPASAHDLRDALEHLCLVRLRHQSRQIGAGHQADNFLDPEALSNFERSQLKDAFGVVKQLQQVLGQRYGAP
jgi:CBS domain-containing protein